MLQNKYILIAKCLVYLKDINNYIKINKGFFPNSPEFEGFNVALTDVVKFDLHFLMNVSKNFNKEDSVKENKEVVFITYNNNDNFTTLKDFTDNIDEYMKDSIPLLEEAVEKYSDELLRKIKSNKIGKGIFSKYNLPYGYSRTKNKKIVFDKKEANTALLVFRTYIRLRSMKKVADALGGSGVESRQNIPIDVGTISGILHDNRYLADEFTKVATVVPTSIYYKAQDILRRNVKQDSYTKIRK